jgi:stage V sporulation protein R
MSKSPADIPTTGPEDYQADIETLTKKALEIGLGYLPIHFRIASQDDLAEIASFGLPNRFNHWYFGGIYKNLKIQQDQKIFKILELVLNTDPIYAFLLDSNSRLENLTVIAHVLGHVDFFVENCWYARSDKTILNRCEEHSRVIRKLRQEHGKEEIDSLITAALTLASSISPFERDPSKRLERPYYFLQDLLETRSRNFAEGDAEGDQIRLRAQILGMMCQEQEYFDLIARTQIMNEGWASFVEFKLLEGFLPREDWLTFSLNFSKRPAPYLIGFNLWSEIFKKKGWLGVYEIRAYYEDVAFIDEFLTQELSEALDLFVQERDSGKRNSDVRKVKAKIIEEKLTKNVPVVTVTSFSEEDGALHLSCQDESRTLDRKRAELFLAELRRLWPHPIKISDAENDYCLNEEGFTREKR